MPPVRAYPRSRGGTRAQAQTAISQRGLSPLTRGNRGDLRPLSTGPGAYPRSRGGTAFEVDDKVVIKGLSPLTRGNLRLHNA